MCLRRPAVVCLSSLSCFSESPAVWSFLVACLTSRRIVIDDFLPRRSRGNNLSYLLENHVTLHKAIGDVFSVHEHFFFLLTFPVFSLFLFPEKHWKNRVLSRSWKSLPLPTNSHDTSNLLDNFHGMECVGNLLEVSWKFVRSRNFHDLERTRFFQWN